MYKPMRFISMLCLLCATNIFAGTIRVSNITQLTTAIASAVPGDSIVVTNGVYTASGIGVACVGTAAQPIVITAETVGGVELNGSSGFSLNSPAAYVVIKGFKFTHNTGTTKINVGATHCTMTRNIFECVASGTGNKPYLSVSGDDNEVSYNTFQNKSTEGCFITIQGPSNVMALRTWIHHNYFYNFLPSANNSSAVQIGLSSRSMSAAYSIVEYNLFVLTRGENEGGVCNKSGNNIYRYNTFGEGCTELSLRHGNFCEVYANFFIKPTGIRIYGDDHKIYNNYFEQCESAINIGNGDGIVPPEGTSELTCHDRPDRIQIAFNTLVNNTNNIGMGGRTDGLGSTSVTVANNIILGGGPATYVSGPYTNPVWEGNIIWQNNGAGPIPTTGYQQIDPQLLMDSLGVSRLKSTSPVIDASVGSYSQVIDDIDGQSRIGKPDVGADEYSNTAIVRRPLTLDDVGAFGGFGMTLPITPNGLTATVISSRKINLAWKDNSFNEVTFQIERSTDGGTTWSLLTSVVKNVISYSDTTVSASIAYHYRVWAENTLGNSEYSNIVSGTTPSALPIIAPSNLVASVKSVSRIDLRWADNSNNEESFRIERSTGLDTTWTFLTVVDINVSQYSDNGLIDSTTYRYRVRAENIYGNSNYSDSAAATTFRLEPSANLTLNMPVTFSSQQLEPPTNENFAALAVDGNTATRWCSARGALFPQWIEVDLGSIKTINKTEVICFQDRPYQYYIEVRADTTGSYTEVLNRRNNTTPGTVAMPIIDVFDSTSARYVKITVTGCYNNPTTWISLSEFRIFLSSDPKTVDVARNEQVMPEGYKLFDAYPNPFNPTTVMSYQLPVTSRVSMKIYDVLGREVTALVNEVKSAGAYKVQWNAKNAPSGMYLVRMTAGNYSKTIKLVLTK